MKLGQALAGCALVLSAGAAADRLQDFNVAYHAYREAMAAGRYDAALEPAAQARELGESLYADDLPRMATLVFNHGFVLGKLKRHDEASPILKRARKLMGEAFGENAKGMLNVEMALLGSAPPSGIRHYMEESAKLARMHHDGNSKLMADIKLQGALRLWGRDATSLLREAAEGYQAAGDMSGYAVAQFWIGKKHFVRREYPRVPKPLNAAIEALPERHQLALMARAHLVEVYEELGQSEKATEHCLAIGRTRPWTGNEDFKPLFKRPPDYPRSALIRNQGGMVLLEFTVDEMGFVKNPKIVESNGGKAFHGPALEAAEKFRYAPRFVDGEAVAVPEVRNRIIFETTQVQRDTEGWTREPVAAVAYHVPLLRTARGL